MYIYNDDDEDDDDNAVHMVKYILCMAPPSSPETHPENGAEKWGAARTRHMRRFRLAHVRRLEIANSCICSAIHTMLILFIQPFSYKNLCAHQLRGVGKLDGDDDDNASDDDVFCIVCPTHESNKLPGGKMYLNIHPCEPTFNECRKDEVAQDG